MDASISRMDAGISIGNLAKPHDPLIIDSGTSNHMISFSFLFSLYNLYSGKEKVRKAYGFVLQRFNSYLSTSYSFVLHFPKFANNLLYVELPSFYSH